MSVRRSCSSHGRELSYQSVAEALELPVGTVRSRLNRARARLRELLEPKGKGRVKSR